ncbi:MAG TPA: hypothetical protein EYP30_09340 [Archaeoglobaceae archaeon]|nr:hypothetical protein [Archaeoglobaceae archaeon]
MVAGRLVAESTHTGLAEHVSEFTHLKLMSLTQYAAIWLYFFGILSLIYGIYAIKRMRTQPIEKDMVIAGIVWGIIMIAAGWYYWG